MAHHTSLTMYLLWLLRKIYHFTSPDVWKTGSTIAAVFVGLAAIVVALFRDKILEWLCKPKILITIPNELGDPAGLKRQPLIEYPRSCALYYHLLVSNSGQKILNARVRIIGILDDKFTPRDINFKRVLPWSYGQVSADDEKLTLAASFQSSLAVDFLIFHVEQTLNSAANTVETTTTLDFALAQHYLHSSKFAIPSMGTVFCVLEVTGDNFSSKPHELMVIKVCNNSKGFYQDLCKINTNTISEALKFAVTSEIVTGSDRRMALNKLNPDSIK